jgi:sugar-specific transcriptional regulator TrmB
MISSQVFEALGFGAKEIKVYLALLELDTATAAELARRVDFNRTSCYDILAMLAKRGLVAKIVKRKKTYFEAGDPRQLVNYLEREKQETIKNFDKKKKMVEEVLPELSSLLIPRSNKPKVVFFEGEKGMREAYEDTLNSRETILAYANVATVHAGLPNFFPEYYKRRAAAGIAIKAIMPDNELSAKRKEQDAAEKRQTILLKDKALTFSPEVNIYNDKVLIASWKEKMAVIIQSKELADLQKVVFNLLWESLKKEES